MKKYRILLALVVCFVLFLSPLGTIAFSVFQEKIAAVGQVEYTDEVTITATREQGRTKFIIWVTSNPATVADNIYKCYIYFDDSKSPATGALDVSWTAAEILAVTEKKITFTGLDLSTVTVVYPSIK